MVMRGSPGIWRQESSECKGESELVKLKTRSWVVAGGFQAEVVPSNQGRTGVAFRVRLQSWGLAIASWIEAGGFARSYQEFNWLVDKGSERAGGGSKFRSFGN